MKNTISKALNALKEQVAVGLSHGCDNTPPKNNIDQPVRIGDLLARAETAREELRHAGYRNT